MQNNQILEEPKFECLIGTPKTPKFEWTRCKVICISCFLFWTVLLFYSIYLGLRAKESRTGCEDSVQKHVVQCSPGFKLLNETGYCYKVVTSKATFAQAESTCRADRAHLASIHSMEENRLLAEMSRNISTTWPVSESMKRLNEQDEVFIGLRYVDGEWEWTDGSFVDFQNWGAGEPTMQSDEWRTTLVTSKIEEWNPTGQVWNNVPESSKQRAFICKKKP